jgi:hypothetical protein
MVKIHGSSWVDREVYGLRGLWEMGEQCINKPVLTRAVFRALAATSIKVNMINHYNFSSIGLVRTIA